MSAPSGKGLTIRTRKKEISPENTARAERDIRRLFRHLLECAKGVYANHSSRWFYNLFPSYQLQCLKSLGISLHIPLDLWEVRERLRAAWWVEEDEILQYLREFIWRKRLYYKRPTQGNYRILRFLLGTELRNWLVFKGKVFSYGRNLRKLEMPPLITDPRVEEEEEFGFREMIFNNRLDFSTYEKYLLYLGSVLGLADEKLAPLLITHKRQILRNNLRAWKKVKENTNGAEKSGRPCGAIPIGEDGERDESEGQD